MVYKVLRYMSLSTAIYFSIVGAEHLFFGGERVNFFVKTLFYLVFCIGPAFILFFGVGASDVDIPRNVEESDCQ